MNLIGIVLLGFWPATAPQLQVQSPPVVQTTPQHVLYRGSTDLRSGRYWSVFDAEIDGGRANESFAQEFFAGASLKRRFLIRFDQLNRAIPNGLMANNVTLVLSTDSNTPVQVSTVSHIKMPWSAPGIASVISRRKPVPGPNGELPPPPAWVTFRERAKGVSTWNPADFEPIKGVKVTSGKGEIRISGLDEWLSNARRFWAHEHGLAIEFSTPGLIATSIAPEGRPRLEFGVVPGIEQVEEIHVEAIEAQSERIKLRLSNSGNSSVQLNQFELSTLVARKALAKSVELPPKSSVDVELELPNLPGGSTENSWFSVVGTGEGARLNYRGYARGRAVPLAPTVTNLAALDVWNEVVLRQSRYSFAPDGAKAFATIKPDASATFESETDALRHIARQLGCIDLRALNQFNAPERQRKFLTDRFPGLLGGDTRGDAQLFSQIGLPHSPYTSAVLAALPIEVTSLLSMTDVQVLSTGKLALPTTSLIRINDLQGRPVVGATVRVQQLQGINFEAEVGTFSTDEDGILVLPKRGASKTIFGDLEPDLKNGVLALWVTAFGSTELTYVKAWHFADAAARGNGSAAILEYRVNLPSDRLDVTRDLALERTVKDSEGSFPAQLVALTDKQLATTYKLPAKKGAWVEVDLGRDRTIGDIEIVTTKMPKLFEIRTYNTGDKPEEADLWAVELDYPWTRLNREDFLPATAYLDASTFPTMVSYRAKSQPVRFVRIINRSGEEGEIRALRAIAVKSG